MDSGVDNSSTLRAAALTVVHRLQEDGFTAYWAGGCVRDMLLKIEPHDYDVATDAHPERVTELFPGASLVGKNFGVVVAPVNGINCEIATFRQDCDYLDGRRPERVVFVTPREDAQRRDFTVNAMFYDPVSDELHDFVGGQQDLQSRLIRCVGEPEQRFAEDHLRLLRAVRFAYRLDFEIEPATAAAIRSQAAKIARISCERVRDELTRILTESRRSGDALLALERLGLLQVILPEVAAMRSQEQPPQFHPEGDVLAHTAIMLNQMDFRDPVLAFAILFHDVGKPLTAFHDGERLRFHGHAERGAELTKKIMKRLRFSNQMIDDVTNCVKRHMRFMDVQKMRKSTLRRLVGSPLFEIEQELHRVDCSSSHGKLDNYQYLQEARKAMEAEPVLPPQWLNGYDIKSLGVEAGPQIGKWLKLAYDMQLNGDVASREDLLEQLRTMIADGVDPAKMS
jgi:poly(A) polymerase